MKEKKKRTTDQYQHLDLCNAACATECTGLIQTWPLSEEDEDAYNQVYNYQPPDIRTGQHNA